MKTAVLLTLMLALIPAANQKYNGEDEDAAKARYEMIADAIADVADGDKRLSLFLLTVARHESTFARKVHTGEVRGDEGRSWGLYQIMCGPRRDGVVPGTEYRAREIVGVDEAATLRATEAAAVHLRKAIKGCQGRPACVFKRYGGISQTAKADGRIKARLATYARLRQLTKKSPVRK